MKGPMSPKGSCPQTFLLLFIMTTFLLLSWSNASRQNTSYHNFLRRHLDNPKSDFNDDSTYCNLMMRMRSMECQRANTFIHSNEQELMGICFSRGEILDGNQSSKTLFPITICIRRQGTQGIRCQYRGRSEIKRIRVTCEKGLPVHYITHM